MIANRLSEDKDVSVLLLEAGGSEFGNEDISIPIRAAATELTKYDWSYYTTPQKYSHQMKHEQVTNTLVNLSDNVYIRKV